MPNATPRNPSATLNDVVPLLYCLAATCLALLWLNLMHHITTLSLSVESWPLELCFLPCSAACLLSYA